MAAPTKVTSLAMIAATLVWTAGCGSSSKASNDASAEDATGTDVQPDTPPDGADTPPEATDPADETDAADAPDSVTAVCGDGSRDSDEKCDDSNLVNGDGCNPTCDLWGTVTRVAGSPGSAGATNGTGAAARFSNPTGIDTDGTDLYVADAGNCAIRRVVIATWDVTTLAGSPGTCAHADATGSAAHFNVPQDVAVDGGDLYVADTDNHVIRRIVISSGVVTTVAGQAGTSGTADGTGGAARFTEPRGVATDGTYLYVADFGNHMIRRIEIGTWAVTTIAGSSTPGSADGTGTAAGFNYPRGIVHHAGMLYVADTNNNTIRSVDPISGAVVTVAGSAGSSGHADGVGAAATFTSPRGIAADAQSLYVTDSGSNAVRQILVGTWEVTTLCGSPPTSGHMDGTGTAATMDGPWGIVFDPARSEPDQILYVSDAGSSILRTVE